MEDLEFRVENIDELARLTKQVKEDTERLKLSIKKLNAFKLDISIK